MMGPEGTGVYDWHDDLHREIPQGVSYYEKGMMARYSKCVVRS
jgi:hypothetical protein